MKIKILSFPVRLKPIISVLIFIVPCLFLFSCSEENEWEQIFNGQIVIDNACLPGVPEKGPIALQHHGGFRDGEYIGNPSLVQFRNIYIKEL